MLWLQSVVLTTPDPRACCRFLSEALSFSVEETRDDCWSLENGTNVLLLQQGNAPPSEVIILCNDVAADSATLLAYEGVTVAGPLVKGFYRIEQRLTCDFGLELRLIRDLNEDERGELLPLPASLEWDDRADGIVRRILRIVPLSFRVKARTRATEAAEVFAVEEGALCVTEHHAMKGLARETFPFQYRALAEAMLGEGVDPSPYVTVPSEEDEPPVQ